MDNQLWLDFIDTVHSITSFLLVVDLIAGLIFLLSIIWAILPLKLYKNPWIRSISYVLLGAMVLIFLSSISGFLISFPVENMEPEGAGHYKGFTIALLGMIGIAISIISSVFFWFIVKKSRNTGSKADLKYVLITIILFAIVGGILVYRPLFQSVKKSQCEIGKQYRYVDECKCPKGYMSSVYDDKSQEWFICEP
jgi:glucan phosphoethanolaminetransferase (alkaline phosphatase superfamily)